MLRILLVVLMIFVFLYSGSSETRPIIIGVATDTRILDGFATIRGLTLAIEEINGAGGVSIGGKKVPFKLEVMDTRDCEPGVPVSEALLVVEKVILDKGADFVIGPSRSEAALAALDVISRYKKVYLLTCGGLSPKLHQTIAENYQKYKYGFRITGESGYMAQEAAELLSNLNAKYGFNRMFIIIQDVAFARAGAEAISGLMKNKGWDILGSQRYPSGATDFSAGLLKARETKAQVIYMMGDMPELSILLNQWYDLKIPALPFGNYLGPGMEPKFWEVTKGKAAYTVVNVVNAGNVPSNATPWTMKFYNAYTKRWGTEPEGYGTVTGYTAPYILKDAIERAGSLEADRLVDALEKTNMVGPYGRIKFHPRSHQIVPDLDPDKGVVGSIFQWQDGKRVVVYPPKIAVGEIKLPPWMLDYWKIKK